MEKIMNCNNIKSFAYINDEFCTKPIKGIVIYFFGLNWNSMVTEDPPQAKAYGENGILYVVPYNRPWAWMNSQAVAYTDEVIDVLVEKFDLPDNIPIVSSGMSMGGQSSIIYCKNSKRTPVACVANCPVCDVAYHFTERVDLPRTFYGAYFYEEGSLDEVLKRFSPLHLVDSLPDISYHIFHCGNDDQVNLHSHSEKFVTAMKAQGRNITFDIVPGRGHCDLTEDAAELFKNYCITEIEKHL